VVKGADLIKLLEITAPVFEVYSPYIGSRNFESPQMSEIKMSNTRSYMIIFAKINDRDAFIKGYAQATAPLVAKYGGRYIMRAPGGTLLEGPDGIRSWGDGASVAISEWPNREAINAFWNSPEYAKAKKLRTDISEVQVLVIDAPKFTQG